MEITLYVEGTGRVSTQEEIRAYMLALLDRPDTKFIYDILFKGKPPTDEKGVPLKEVGQENNQGDET